MGLRFRRSFTTALASSWCLIAAMPCTAAPGVFLDCQMRQVPSPQGSVRIEIDFLKGMLEVRSVSGASTYRITEQTEELLRAEAGNLRLMINRKTGLLLMGTSGKDAIVFDGACTKAQEKLF